MRARRICAVLLLLCAAVLLAGTGWKLATGEAGEWRPRSATKDSFGPGAVPPDQ